MKWPWEKKPLAPDVIPPVIPPTIDRGICVRTYKYELEIDTGYSHKPRMLIFYHLFENKDGGKAVVVDCSSDANRAHSPEKQALRTEFFHMNIYPWLHGRPTDDIPTFADAQTRDFKKDEFTDTLKG